MQKEQQTVIVAVTDEENELDTEARYERIGAKVGQGWKVINAIPLGTEGGDYNGNADGFTRYEVLLERTIDDQNVVVDPDKAP